jgi:hypothetical protein
VSADIWWENLKGEDHLEDTDIDDRTLKWNKDK